MFQSINFIWQLLSWVDEHKPDMSLNLCRNSFNCWHREQTNNPAGDGEKEAFEKKKKGNRRIANCLRGADERKVAEEKRESEEG